MWAAQVLLAVIGISAGMAVAAGLFSFIVELGVIADFADRTHTGEKILFYEDCVALGGIVGNIIYVFHIGVPLGTALLAMFGLFAGIFVGCWAMALAEIPGADREISDGLCDQHGTGKGDWSVSVLFPGMVTVRLG